MMSVKEIRTFLVGQPRPSRIVLTLPDETTQEMGPPVNGRSWQQIAESIGAQNVQLIQLFDSNGQLLRARNLQEELLRKAEFAETLGVPGADTETARLTHFANLLYRATEFSTKLAFEKMVELFGLMNERSVALETRLERAETQYRKAMQDRLDDAFETAEDMQAQAAADSSDPATQLVKAFTGGAAAAQTQNGARK